MIHGMIWIEIRIISKFKQLAEPEMVVESGSDVVLSVGLSTLVMLWFEHSQDAPSYFKK